MQSDTQRFFAVLQKADTRELLELLHALSLEPEKHRDQRGYSALHIAALNSTPELVECLFTYMRNNYKHDPRSTIRRWVAQPSEEGFTCVHFAAFRGSLVTRT